MRKVGGKGKRGAEKRGKGSEGKLTLMHSSYVCRACGPDHFLIPDFSYRITLALVRFFDT